MIVRHRTVINHCRDVRMLMIVRPVVIRISIYDYRKPTEHVFTSEDRSRDHSVLRVP